MFARVTGRFLLLSIILGFGGCAASPVGTARFDENLVDPDRPLYPIEPPANLAQGATFADLNKVINLLKHQSQYAKAVLREYPGDQKAQRVKAYTDQALPIYQSLMTRVFAERVRNGAIKPGHW